jgi:signal peptidase I
MSIDFPFWLLTATVISGLIVLADKIYCYYNYTKKHKTISHMSRLVDYARSFFPLLLIVLILRSFLFEPFKVPTGSLSPSVLPGDFILSNKFAYGLRLPVWGYKLLNISDPKNGDIAIFRTPGDNKTWMVKRVIGIPGDKVSYIDKKFIVNDKPAQYRLFGQSKDTNDGVNYWPVEVYEEDIFNIKHKIFIKDNDHKQDFHITVPAGHYFMVGDNRDNSDDSRFWGLVPEANLEGKAILIWFSWDQFDWKNFRWSRIGTWLNN